MALTLAHAPNDSQAARIVKSRAANWRENSGGLLCAKAPLRRRTDQLELPSGLQQHKYPTDAEPLECHMFGGPEDRYS